MGDEQIGIWKDIVMVIGKGICLEELSKKQEKRQSGCPVTGTVWELQPLEFKRPACIAVRCPSMQQKQNSNGALTFKIQL
jgi:hypothetical protein